MASFDTYGGLKDAVALWLMRDDLTEHIPLFIELAESRSNRRLRVREMESSTTLTPDGDNVCTLPTDYIEAVRVRAAVNPVTVLEPITLDFAQDNYSTAGFPFFYTIQGNELTAYPPNSANIYLDYYAAIPALSDSNTSNWLLSKAPEIYLYGSLLESAPFMEDDERLATWISLYKAAVDELLQADSRGKWSRGSSRVRSITP